jgi:uncharacterized Zn finger protein
MNNIPPISEQAIRTRVGEQSFQRGYEYFRGEVIIQPKRQGMTLKALCEGSRSTPYRVQVTFGPHEITEGNCSCPVGAGGYCKHVAALLLTWQAQPDIFIEVEDLDTTLARRSKDELIALIKQMLRKEPDLEALVEAPAPAAGKRSSPVNPEVYRRQVAGIFRRHHYDYDDYYYEEDSGAGEIAEELLPIRDVGDGFAREGDYANAATVYTALIAGVMEHYEDVGGDTDELEDVVASCVDGLGICLDTMQGNSSGRQALLQTLFDLLHFGVEHSFSGLSAGVPEVLSAHTTPEERQLVVDRVREALPVGDDLFVTSRRQRYGGVLLTLAGNELDDETFLRICRETGRTRDVVERLLTLGRVDEAARDAGQAADRDMVMLADLFVQHGHAGAAEDIMLIRSRKTTDIHILEWLKTYYKTQRDLDAALELVERLFRLHPSMVGYKEMRTLAGELGRWDALRAGMLAWLKETNVGGLLIEIYLDEGEIDAALEMLEAMKTSGNRSGGFYYSGAYYAEGLSIVVARAAEAQRPRAALRLFQQEAERLIAQRGRENYQLACRHLAKVRDLYDRLGESEAWTRYVSTLREQNRSLRALKEELTAAHL